MRASVSFGLVTLVAISMSPAQVRVTLQHESPRDQQLAALVGQLAQAETRAAASDKLWALGPVAVPALTAAVARGDAAAPGALAVLTLLGGDARAAWPALHKLAASGDHALQRELDHALAAIGERDSILLTDFNGPFVIELDADGKELRRVQHANVWGVQPIAGDHLLVASDGNFVEEIDWVGKVLASRAVPQAVLDARRLPDGGMVAACWRGPCAVRYGADGKQQWRVQEVHATDIEPLASGNFLIAGFDDNLLLEVDAAGNEIWRLPTKDGPMDVDALPNGNLLVAFDRSKRVVEIDRAGNELHTLQLPGSPQDAQRLRDGRTLVGIDHGAVMFGADGIQLWRFDGGQCGHVVARLAPTAIAK